MEISAFWACEPDEVADNPFLTMLEAVAEGDLCILEAALAAVPQGLGFGSTPPRPLPTSINPAPIIACVNRQQDALEMLLERDPESINAVDVCHGAGLVHWAACAGDTGILAFLLQHNSSFLHARDVHGMLPVHYAAANGKRAALRLLVEASPTDVNAVAAKPSGFTPLILAARYGHDRCIEYLIAHGARLNDADLRGSTALLEAAEGGHSSTARILLNAGIVPSSSDSETKRSALHWSAYYGDVQLAKSLLDRTPPLIFEQDCKGETALLIASRRGHQGVVDLLLACGANVDLANNDGVTPLMAASLFGHKDAVISLLNSGASMFPEKKSGRTPMHYAVLSGESQVVKALLKAGASVTVVDVFGHTPSDYARNNDDQEIINVFLL